MSEKENKSIIRRFVEGNKKFTREIHGVYIVCTFVVFVTTFVISYFLLDTLEKTVIDNSIIISAVFATLSLFATLSIKPKAIFIFSTFIAILISSIMRLL